MHNLFVADIDGDGDTDVLSVSATNHRINWYENRGGQLALPTSDVAYEGMVNTQVRQVLEIAATHRGRVADDDAELLSLDLFFTDNVQVALLSPEAKALIENLWIYRDTGDGIFNSGTDTPVATISSLSLSAGELTVSFAGSEAEMQVSQATPEIYFVVIELKSDAASQPKYQFEISHQTSTGGAGENSVYDNAIELEARADVSTGIIEALDLSEFVDDDDDGLNNLEEATIYFTDPLDADTDDDGIEDGAEVAADPHVTDPLNDDTDGDGLLDGDEIAINTDPTDPDTDGDGHCDGPSDPGGLACPGGVSDNCPNVSNAGQEDNDLFSAGDACQCGNVDGAGGIDATDLQRIREFVVGANQPPPPNLPDFCDVNDDQACDVGDLFVLQRAINGASAVIQDRCDVYLGQ
jgi:hypothetical protein